MRKHTKNYYKAMGYHLTDFIPSEISGIEANDLHHIVTREDIIENVMAVTRSEHLEYGDNTQYMVFLLKVHRDFLDRHNVVYDNAWFENWITFYETLNGKN
jgi:hypothetical protein